MATRKDFETMALSRPLGTKDLVDELADLYTELDPEHRICPKHLAVHRAVSRDLNRLRRRAGREVEGEDPDDE